MAESLVSSNHPVGAPNALTARVAITVIVESSGAMMASVTPIPQCAG